MSRVTMSWSATASSVRGPRAFMGHDLTECHRASQSPAMNLSSRLESVLARDSVLRPARLARLKLFRNFRKSALTFQSQSFQNLERVFGSSSQLCWKLLNSFSYYSVFNSQNLSLKFGFRIHTFARIDTFWDPESILSEQNRNLEFQSFDSGPKKF